MGRPKASPRNLSIALAFANTVTLSTNSCTESDQVHCKGNESLFAALCTCLPGIVRRLESDSNQHLKVSCVELNKALADSGYVPCRKRKRLAGSSSRWTKGVVVWSNRRVANPRDSADLFHIQHGLSQMHNSFPETRALALHEVLATTTNILGARLQKSSPTYHDWCAASSSTQPIVAGGWGKRFASVEEMLERGERHEPRSVVQYHHPHTVTLQRMSWTGHRRFEPLLLHGVDGCARKIWRPNKFVLCAKIH
jgi:hypothetical protein